MSKYYVDFNNTDQDNKYADTFIEAKKTATEGAKFKNQINIFAVEYKKITDNTVAKLICSNGKAPNASGEYVQSDGYYHQWFYNSDFIKSIERENQQEKFSK